MSQTHTLALVHQEDGNFGISFPDFPGCISTAGSFADVVERGRQALALHIEGMIEDGVPMPLVATGQELFGSEEARGAIVVAVPVEMPGRAVRVQITMDENLLAALDRQAKVRGATRSGAIAEAVRASLRA
jgi:predicted RNase H-like HicB family nuclease